jgi:hypothetical protein
MPSLSLPFALVGAAAGWLCAGVLGNPMFGPYPAGNPHIAVVVTVVVGALVGAFVTRRCSTAAESWASTGATRLTLVLAVMLAGAVSGALVGGLTWWTGRGAFAGVFAGLGCALGFLPVCALVLASARRAERARLGSLVAGSDRRAVWSMLASTVAVTTLLALPDWPAVADGAHGSPEVAWAIALCACVTNAAIAVAEWRASRRIDACAGSVTEPRDSEDAASDADVPRVDLGLGEGVLATVMRAASAYRDRDRTVELLLGDPATARAAVKRALARAAAGAALASVVLWMHFIAARPEPLAMYREWRCREGSAEACRSAAQQHQRGEALHSTMGRGIELHLRACWLTSWESCVDVAAADEQAAHPTAPRTAVDARDRACRLGHVASCRIAADAALRTEQPELSLARAAALFNRACALRDDRACLEADVLRPGWRKSVEAQLVHCLLGDGRQCADVAHEATKDSVLQAARLRELACEHHDALSCVGGRRSSDHRR